MDPATFLEGRTRETSIFRDDLGRWFHDGQPLSHPSLCRAFDRWVSRADDGRYCLRNSINWAYIRLEGPPYFVRRVRLQPDGVQLLLSDDRQVPLEPASLRQDRRGALYCDVGEGLCARFDRFAMTQLEELIHEDSEGVYLALGGGKVRPPVVDDPLVPVLPDGEAS